jgi:hypothetical protein
VRRKMSKEVIEQELIKKLEQNTTLAQMADMIYHRMLRLHSKECTATCFTFGDVLLKLAEDLNIIPFEPACYEYGTVWWHGYWGNVSFSHFLHFYFKALKGE